MDLTLFRETYPAKAPRIDPQPDECVQMQTADGLGLLTESLQGARTIDRAPRSMEEADVNRYLWVVGLVSAPYGLERGDFGKARLCGAIKHTNLTAGHEAHCGGELWLLEDGRAIINGDSGRYGPNTEQQLRDVALCLKSLGYTAGYMRFGERNLPLPIIVGEDDLVWP